MKTKLRKFGAWLMAAALALAGASAYGDETKTLDVSGIAAGGVLEISEAGTYKFPNLPNNITLKATVEGVVFDCKGSGSIASVPNGAKLEGLSFVFGSSGYHGWQGAGKMEFSHCAFDGLFFSYGDMIFTDCTFTSPGTEYCMWCYAGNVTYKGCTVNCQGKFANVYNEHNGSWKIVAEGCTFNSTKVNKAALNVKSTCGTGLKFDVTVNNCTVNENFPAASTSDSLIVFNGVVQLDDIKADAPNEITITQDGKVLYADNAVAGPEVAIEKPTKEEVVEKTETTGDVSAEQKAAKADAVVAVIAKAAEEETLEVSKSGLSAAGKTADGKLADPLVTALKAAADEEKKAEITNETKVKKTIDVVFKGMTVEAGEKVTTTKIAYDVTPKALATLADGTEVKAAIPNGTFEKINFRMPLTADFAGRWLKVSRTDNGTDFVDVGLYQAQKDGDVDYVQVDGDHFTTYVNEISDVTPVASINGKGYVTLEEAVAAAEDGQTIKVIKPDTYKLPDFTAQVTLESVEGVSYNCKDNLKVVGGSQQVCGITKPVTFKGGSFDFGENIYRGFIFKTGSLQDIAAKVTFDGAYIKGIICGHGDLEFKDCTIEQISSSQYPIRSWGSPTITCTGCTFLTGGRAILVYREGYPNSQQTVNVSGCHFLTKEGQTIDSKGAVQVNPADKGTAHYDVTISDCDASEAYTGLWDIKLVSGKGPDALILLDDDQVYPEPVAQIGTKKYSTLADAIAAVPEGFETPTTIRMLGDVTYTEVLQEAAYNGIKTCVIFPANRSIVLDLNGHTIESRDDGVTGYFAFMSVFGELVVDDQSEAKAGKIVMTPTTQNYGVYSCTIQVFDGLLTVRNGLVKNAATTGLCYAVEAGSWHLGGRVVVEGGELVGVAGVRIHPNFGDNGTYELAQQHPLSFTMTGGSITSQEEAVFYHNGGGVSAYRSAIDITGGAITYGQDGIRLMFVYPGEVDVNVSGDVVVRPVDGFANGKAFRVQTWARVAQGEAERKNQIRIAGGTFAGEYFIHVTEEADNVDDILVTGGKFSGSCSVPAANAKIIASGVYATDPNVAGYARCAVDGCIFVPNTDSATKAEGYLWMVGPQQLQPKTDEAEAEAKPEEKANIPAEKQDEIPAAVETVKVEVAQAATSKEVTQFADTGLSEAVVKPDGSLDARVVEALKAAVTSEAAKQKIGELSSDSNSTKRIQIELKKIDVGLAVDSEAVVGSANEVSYDVVPRVKTVIEVKNEQGEITETIESDAQVPNDTIANSPITFRLGVTWAEGEKVKVFRDTENFGITTVKTGTDGNYVELTSNHFSTFKLLKVTVPTVCKVGELEFETIDDAIAASDDSYGTTIEMLADVDGEVTVTGLGKRVIDTNGKSFEAVITPAEGTELVKGKGGKFYLAAPKVEVPTGESTVMPIRGYVFPSDVTTPEAKAGYLAGDSTTTGNKVWQDYAMFGNEGVRVKLTPEIVKAAAGSSVVTIRAAGDYVLACPTRCGVKVSFQLLKRDGVTGNFAEVGEASATPSFAVDVKEIGPKTYWKIQTVFSCEEEQ